jgi:protein TonB
MIPLFPNHPDHMRLQWQGWICSVVFHAVVGASALALVSGLKISVEPDPFNWHVVMVDVPQAQPSVDALPEAKPTPPKPQVAEAQPAPAQPMVETVQRVVQPVHPVPKIVQHEPTTVNQTASVVTQPVQHSETSTSVAPTATREAVVQEEQVVATHAAITQHTSAPFVAEPPIIRQDTEPAVQHTPVETTSETTARSQSPAVEQMASLTVPTKADYGWLVKALLGRLDQLKNYPQLARINHWEGKVILRAVIKDDGQVLMINIHESSGRSILDDDAIDTLRRASPLKLDHPLGKPQVAILMPISYALR